MGVINLSTLEAERALNPHRNVKTLTTWNHHPWTVAQTGPSSEVDTVGGEIRYQPVHPFRYRKNH